MREDDQEVHTAEDAAVDGAVLDVEQADADAKAEPYQPSPYDDLAKRMGWRTPEEYDPGKSKSGAKFLSAEEFIVTRANQNESLKRDLKEVRRSSETLAKTAAAITAREVAKARAEVEERHREAVEQGDLAGVKQAEKDLRTLEAQTRDTTPETRFATENPWYGSNDEATAYAVSVSQRLAQQGKSPEEQLEAVATQVRKRFPELFDEDTAPKPKSPPVVHRPQGAPVTRAREKGFNDLPADAKRAWESYDKQFKRAGHADGYPKDEYAKEYWSNAA